LAGALAADGEGARAVTAVAGSMARARAMRDIRQDARKPNPSAGQLGSGIEPRTHRPRPRRLTQAPASNMFLKVSSGRARVVPRLKNNQRRGTHHRPRVIQRCRCWGPRLMSLSSLERGPKPRHVLPKWSPLEAPLAPLDPNQILSFHEWCRLNRISIRTGRRILTSGNGPVITQLSPNRFGITVANNAAWQRTRERASPLPPAQTLPRQRRQPASPQKRRTYRPTRTTR
jgi:hypothetical protein